MLAVEPSPKLRSYIQDIGNRVDAIQQRLVASEEDNMLKVSSDGRKAALDMRLMAEASKPEEQTQPEAATEFDPRLEKMHAS